jgi:hypothetical protein
VEITVDNAVSWVDVTASLNTSTFVEVMASKAALTNPVIGVRITTSGDEVVVGNAETHLTKTEAEVRGSAPIVTAGVAGSTVAMEIVWPASNINPQTNGVVYLEITTMSGVLGSHGLWQLTSSSGGWLTPNTGNGAVTMYYTNTSDARVIVSPDVGTFLPDTTYKAGFAAHDAANDIIGKTNPSQTTQSATNFKQFMDSDSTFRIGRSPIHLIYVGLYRNIRIYKHSWRQTHD